MGGVANMAGWCWCWVCDLREKCEVARLEMERGRAGPEEWCGGIWGERCFGRLMLVALLALLLRLRREKDGEEGRERETACVTIQDRNSARNVLPEKTRLRNTDLPRLMFLFFLMTPETVMNPNGLLHQGGAGRGGGALE